MAKASKETQDTKEKFSLSLDKSLLRKLKYVSAVDDRFQNEIFTEALTTYLEKWERENGKIKIKE